MRDTIYDEQVMTRFYNAVKNGCLTDADELAAHHYLQTLPACKRRVWEVLNASPSRVDTLDLLCVPLESEAANVFSFLGGDWYRVSTVNIGVAPSEKLCRDSRLFDDCAHPSEFNDCVFLSGNPADLAAVLLRHSAGPWDGEHFSCSLAALGIPAACVRQREPGYILFFLPPERQLAAWASGLGEFSSPAMLWVSSDTCLIDRGDLGV